MIPDLTTEVQHVAPEWAAQKVREGAFEGQRKLRPKHVGFLASEMAANRFRPTTVVEFGVVDGHEYLTNGQHTLSAVAEYGKPVQLVIVRQPVASFEEMVKLYNTHDTGLSRTLADAYAALGLAKRFSMTDPEINLFGRAVPFVAGNFAYKATREARLSRSREERIVLMDAFHGAARTYLDCLKPAEPLIRKALLIPPVFAIGIYTIHYSRDRAMRFWTLAADDQNLAKSEPPKAATVLIQRVTRPTEKGQTCLAQSLATVWNAFVLEREIRKPRLITQPSESVRILGTPLSEEIQPNLPEVEREDDDALDTALADLKFTHGPQEGDRPSAQT